MRPETSPNVRGRDADGPQLNPAGLSYHHAQDVLGRVSDSVIGSYKSDFIEKTEGNADLCDPLSVPNPDH